MTELRLADVDRDGAIEEAFDKVSGGTRADFMRKTLVGGAAAVAALTALEDAHAAEIPRGDVSILNYALSLEYLQSAFYTEPERIGALRGKALQTARILGGVERAHVTAFRSLLGPKAIPRATYNFQGVTENQRRFLNTAVAFEDLAVAAYKGQATRVRNKSVLAAAVSIHSVEARHAAWMRYLFGITPAGAAFDQPRSREQINRVVASTRFVSQARPRTRSRRGPRFTG